MIYDKINNIPCYSGLSKDIYEGLAFLAAMKQEIETGVHVINPRVRAIVSEYETKEQNELPPAFYEEADVKPQELLLGNGYFAILYPQDGHMPQLCVKAPTTVKKVGVKVKV